MVYRTRIKYTAEQKADMWDRWQRGESLKSIGRVFDRPSGSIFGLLAPSGGIRPAPRQRSRLALTLSEREEISRGIASDLSLRTIAAQLGRSRVSAIRAAWPCRSLCAATHRGIHDQPPSSISECCVTTTTLLKKRHQGR